MPAGFSHIAIPVAPGFGLFKKPVSSRLMAADIAASVLPDVDGIFFWAGIAYASIPGHRKLIHSLLCVLRCALPGRCFTVLCKRTR